MDNPPPVQLISLSLEYPMDWIDIRSDTVTVPTEAMRLAMSKAKVGDDVYGQDPTVNELQELAAKMFGKEAALFTPSGLMSNQLSIMSWTNPGNEIIVWENAHIIDHEAAALTILSAVQTRHVASKTGILTPEEIEPLIRKDQGILYPKTALICLENSLSNGKVWSLQKLKAVKTLAQKYNIRVHIDGARIFNAMTTSKCDIKELSQCADSISFCLSKGLCCPIGSIIVGTKEMIDKARKFRKSIGGGMRQSGILAAAGIVALTQMIEPLKEDHRIAKYIGSELQKIEGVKVDTEFLEANMVFFEVDGINAPDLIKNLEKDKIKMNEPFEPFFNYRIAVHYYIREEQANKILKNIREFIQKHRVVKS